MTSSAAPVVSSAFGGRSEEAVAVEAVAVATHTTDSYIVYILDHPDKPNTLRQRT